MDLTHSDTQRSLAETARSFLERHVPFERVRKLEGSDVGFDDELWSAIVANSWTEIPFTAAPDTDLAHLAVLLQELGRSAFVSPFFQSVAAAGITVHRLGDTPLAKQVVGRISKGDRGALVASADPAQVARGTRHGTAVTFSGGPLIVEWAHIAEFLVCPVRVDDDDFTLVVIEPDSAGVVMESCHSIDHERVALVTLNGVVCDGDRQLMSAPRSTTELCDALALVRLLRAAEMIGGIGQALALTVEHVQARHQFGRSLANFQAVQHICADMLTECDGANLSVWEALTRIEAGSAARPHAAAATFFTGRAYERVTRMAAQLHGGIGFMSEYSLQYHFRRAKAQRLRLGTRQFQLETVARHFVDPVVDSGRFPTRALTPIH